MARVREERLPKRVVLCGEMVGSKAHSGGQELDWMRYIEYDPKGFNINFKGWRDATQKAGRWFRRVEGGAKVLMRICRT